MRTVLLHCHIFKNGGTTIDGVLSKNFGDLAINVERQDGPFFPQSAIVERAMSNERVVSIASHKIALPAPHHESIQFIPLVMLSDSWDRLGSMYAFYRRQTQDINHECRLAKRVSFRSFVDLLLKTGLNRSFSNLQSFFFLGNTTPQLYPSKTTWPVIATNFSDSQCVGTLELFDESMVLWEEYLQEFIPRIDLSYTKKNTSMERPPTIAERLRHLEGELGSALVLKFKENNEFDYQLYQMAQQRIRYEIERRMDFSGKLREFKGKNQCVQSDTHAMDSTSGRQEDQGNKITLFHRDKQLQISPFPPEWCSTRTGAVDIVGCELLEAGSGLILSVVEHGLNVEVLITVQAHRIIHEPIIGITVQNSRDEVVFCMNSFHCKIKMAPPAVGENVSYSFGFTIPPLNSDSYTISPAFAFGSQENHTMLCQVKDAVLFFVPVMIKPRLPGFLYISDYSFTQPITQ